VTTAVSGREAVINQVMNKGSQVCAHKLPPSEENALFAFSDLVITK